MNVKLAEGIEHYDEGYSSDENLSANLDFNLSQFYGRINELRVLDGVFQQLCETNVIAAADYRIPVCLIDGHSGSGKSALVSKFVEGLTKQIDQSVEKGLVLPPFFIKGKYDQLECKDPFSAIADALSEFLGGILLGDRDEMQLLRCQILRVMGSDEVNILTTLLPDLKGVVGQETIEQECPHHIIQHEMTANNVWNRLKYAFLQLFKAICTARRPIIMFLDDLNWADDASLTLITALLTDRSLHHFMLIGSFVIQENEVYEDHAMRNDLKAVPAIRHSQRIKLKNLSMEETGMCISDILHSNKEDTKELTEKVYKKTRGNPFFIRQAIEELERKKVVYFCYISFCWQWDLDRVETYIPDNVSTVVLNKILALPGDLQKILTIAAYLRSSFDILTIQTLIDNEGCSINSDKLLKLLDMAVLKGLLLKHESLRMYTFSHDHIQRAAYSLPKSVDEETDFRLRLGKCLWRFGLTEYGEDWMLFVAADHLNSINMQDLDPLFVARVNLKVGSIAFSMASCEQAAAYLQISVSSLKEIPNHWVDHYEMSLLIYRILADSEFYTGRFDVGSDLSRLLLEKAVCITDKIPTYFLFASALHRQNLTIDALKLHQAALHLLGEYPKYCLPFHTIKIITRLWYNFKNKSDEEVLSLPTLTDERKIAAMRFLVRATISAENVGKIQEFALCILRGVEITIESGLCSESAYHLTNYGIFLNIIGNYKGALRLVGLAQKVLQCYSSKCVEAGHIFASNYLVLGWSNPNSDELLFAYHRGYENGMQSGDIEAGLANRFAANYLAYDSGISLPELKVATEDTMAQSRLYNSNNILQPCEQLNLLLRCLMGNTQISWKELEHYDDTIATSQVQMRHVYLVRLQLGVYFSEYSFAKKMAKKLAPLCKNAANGICAIAINWWLFSFLVVAKKARQTGKLKYRSKAQNIAKDMISYTRRRSNIFLNIQFLMEAELMSLRKEAVKKVSAAFDKAILTAAKSCRIHYVALACEKAGDYFSSIMQKGLMLQYLTLARDCYQKWGATAKVAQLEGKQACILGEIELESDVGRYIRNYLSEYQTESKLLVTPAYIPAVPKLIRRKSAATRSRSMVPAIIPCLVDSDT